VTIWPSPPSIDNSLPMPPTYPVPPGYIDNTLPPAPPTMWPKPPVTTWPPPTPVWPTHPIYIKPPHVGGGPMPGGERPDQGLPGAPPTAGQPLPGDQPVAGQPLPMPPGSIWPPAPGLEGPVVALVWLVGYGYRWASIDPSLEVGMPLPGGPPDGEHPDQSLPPHAQPRRRG
jgi:hypothetical protein